MFYIFSESSILQAIEYVRSNGTLPHDAGSIDLFSYHSVVDGFSVFTNVDGTETENLIVVGPDLVRVLGGSPRDLERALQRIHRVAAEFARPPISLPPAWRKYQLDRKIAFFALPPELNSKSHRWIAEHRDGAVIFWEVTSVGNEVPLADHVSNYSGLREYRKAWSTGVDTARRILEKPESVRRLQSSVDLEVVGSRAVSRNRTYSEWMNLITADQREVISHPLSRTMKIRGAAGSGKTLTLQLKALSALYAAEARVSYGGSFRVLYLTHGWALAELVDASITCIDDKGHSGTLDIFPLMFLRESLHGPLPEGARILGEDGLGGKREQLRELSIVVGDFVLREWATYSSHVSPHIRELVEANDSEAMMRLCWMLLCEFNEVLDAYGFKPSHSALAKYIDMHRASWMISLPNRDDRKFVFGVFRLFVSRMATEGLITTDQSIADFRRYLESYSWNIRRQQAGYDLILVDEFHLFSDTERYILQFLHREAESAPPLVCALDPRQSQFEVLTGLTDDRLARDWFSMEPGEGVDSVQLSVVHRFSKPILDFVTFVYETNSSMLDEGADWTFELGRAASSDGSRPRVEFCDTKPLAVSAALDLVRSAAGAASAEERCALVASGHREFDDICATLGDPIREFTIVRGRDDVERLNYVRRSIAIVSSADAAGLQFSHVVVLAYGDSERSYGGGAVGFRKAVADLYRAVTRAESTVQVVTTRDKDRLVELLERAGETGVVQTKGSF